MNVNFVLFEPTRLRNLFVIKEDKSLWNASPRYIKRGNVVVPNREKYLKQAELLVPKDALTASFFHSKSPNNFGIYILLFEDFRKFYVGVAARYSHLKKNGELKKHKTPEGFHERLRKHRAKCTGTYLPIAHTDKKNNGWRTFALERAAHYSQLGQVDSMQDCFLSLIVFENHESFQHNDKGMLEMLESHISNSDVGELVGERFSGYESFAHTTNKELAYDPKYNRKRFPFLEHTD